MDRDQYPGELEVLRSGDARASECIVDALAPHVAQRLDIADRPRGT
jgi:hypothetical protein